MSMVYEAFDERVDRRVALKLMLVDDEADDRARLRREAQALAQLSHPNVVEVYEIGDHEGRAFVAMELVDGHPLDRWLRLRRRTTAEIVEQFLQAGMGLAAAHAEGLIHRDFKPSNVLVGSSGRVRVVDFGLVRESAEASSAEGPSADGPPSETPLPNADESSPFAMRQTWSGNLTRTGAMVGTPAYMSPEQLSSMPVGPASDQFSFCTALFEALYDHHPYVADGNWQQLPYNVLEGEIQQPKATRRIPSALARTLVRGLSVRPEERWPSMEALLEQLRRAVEPRRPRMGLTALALGAIAASLLAIGPLDTSEGGGRCDEAASLMKKAWAPPSRSSLRRAWLESRLPGAADAWTRAQVRLDTYVDDWWAAHGVACEAEAPAEGRAVCVQRLAKGFAAHLEVIEDPDEAMVHKLVPMISDLPDPRQCDSSRIVQAPPSTEDSLWADELHDIDARIKAGQYELAGTMLEALMSGADLDSSPRLTAMVYVRLGTVLRMTARLDASSRAFEDAYFAAKQLGLDEISADSALALLQIHGEERYRAAEAARWTGHARAEVERLDDPKLYSAFLNAAGRALRSKGDIAGALEHHQRALEVQREYLPEGHHYLGHSLFQIGTCLNLQGKGPEGLRALNESLEIYQKSLGPRHPRVSAPLTNIGVYYINIGRLDDALNSFNEALELLEKAYPNNPLYARFSYINISLIHAERGRYEEAAATLRQYVERYRASIDEEEFDVGHFEGVLCQMHLYENHYDEAIVHCSRASEALEEQWGSDHPQFAESLAMLGRASVRADRLDAALTHYERALAIQRGQPDADVKPVTDVLVEIAGVHMIARQDDRARARFEEARSMLAKSRGEESPMLVPFDVDLAMLDVNAGAPQAALIRLRRAKALLEAHQADNAVDLASLLAVMANAERLTGDLESARANAEQAVSLVDDSYSEQRAVTAMARFALAQALGSSGLDRSRAKTLARQAAEGYATLGADGRRSLEEIETWLSSR